MQSTSVCVVLSLSLAACGGAAQPLTAVEIAGPRFDLASATRSFQTVDDTMTENGRHARKSAPRARKVSIVGEPLMLECEAYFAQLDACIDKLPEDMRVSFVHETSRMREAWASIDDVEDRESIRLMCLSGVDTWSHEGFCR